jgi:hypothetical protein
MPRIPREEMEKREKALQQILEANLEGLTVNQLVEALEAKGEVLPKSKYQAVNIVLKKAEGQVTVHENGKWRLMVEDEDPVEVSEEVTE